MMVDSVGMSTLFLPDVQYHFHGMNPDDVVIHAYNMLYFILENDNPVGDGDTISLYFQAIFPSDYLVMITTSSSLVNITSSKMSR